MSALEAMITQRKSATVTVAGKERVISELTVNDFPDVVQTIAELLTIVPLEEWEGMGALPLFARMVRQRALYDTLKKLCGIICKLSEEDIGNMSVAEFLRALKTVLEINDATLIRDSFFELRGQVKKAMTPPTEED